MLPIVAIVSVVALFSVSKTDRRADRCMHLSSAPFLAPKGDLGGHLGCEGSLLSARSLSHKRRAHRKLIELQMQMDGGLRK